MANETFGSAIIAARKAKGLSQKELAERIVLDGKAISPQYLNDIEHNLRHPPRGYLLEQFAKELDLDVDLLYFLAKQLPVGLDSNKVSEEQAIAAYRAFRRELQPKGKKKR